MIAKTIRVLTLIALSCCCHAVTQAAGFYIEGGRVRDAAGREIQLRGVNHFGFNTPILVPQYLWAMGWKEQLAQIKELGFNAVRVPYVPDTLYSTARVDSLSYLEPARNADLIGKTSLQVLDLWMAEADRLELYVVLDFHSVTMRRAYPTWFVDSPADFHLVYNGQAYSPEHWLRDLSFVAQRYAERSHFIGIDIFNEPNGAVRWRAGDPNVTDTKFFWSPAVAAAAGAILAANPNLLIFVQGTTANFDGMELPNIPINWGENFQPQTYAPLNIPADKLVLSPHTYGPDVYAKTSFQASNYPTNLAADWEILFGRFAPDFAVIPGEWGGRYGRSGAGISDVAWQDAFVAYMIEKGMRSSFYWCYTPNSGDTGGILDDDLSVRTDKMMLLKRHWEPVIQQSSGTPSIPSAAPSAPSTSQAVATTEQGGGAAHFLWLLPFALWRTKVFAELLVILFRSSRQRTRS